jgi:DNA-directed RNA polymerase specialized sigma24 family protein
MARGRYLIWREEGTVAREYADDDALVARALAGDTGAFAALVERYRQQVYALAYRHLGDAHEADDAAQEIFVRAYVHLADYHPRTQFAPWLLALAARQCATQRRRRGQEWRVAGGWLRALLAHRRHDWRISTPGRVPQPRSRGKATRSGLRLGSKGRVPVN